MFARRVLLAASFAVCAALGPTALPLSYQDSQSGPASGTWALPRGSGQSDGYIHGILYLAPADTVRFYFDATLTDVFTPSLSQIKGTIDGILDDGFGPAPDYVVKGSYAGNANTGSGTFTCVIRRPGSTQDVGKIDGTFADAPGSTTPGTFSGEWKITQ
jgi:hypothetical protein